MVAPLPTAVIVSALLLAGWCLLTAARDRTVGPVHLAGVAVVELVLLIQVGVAVARMAGGHQAGDTATFIGYLVATPLVLPAGAALAVLERTRWGGVLLGIAALVVPVLVVRLQQIWNG
jgi:hypothetical protein